MTAMATQQRTMHIMDHTGDTKIIWNSENADETAHARDTFDKFKKKGYAAFNVKKGGEQGTIMRDFDPDAEKMILTPPLAGG